MKARIRSTPLFNALSAIRSTVRSHVGKKPTVFQRAVYCRLTDDCLWLLYCAPDSALRLALAVPAEMLHVQSAEKLPGLDFDDALLALRHMPEDITVDVADTGGLRLSCDFGDVTLPPCDYDMQESDWPEALEPGEVEADILAEIIRAVLVYSGDDDVLGCLHFIRDKGGRVRAEALDGHQYASISLAAPHLAAALPAQGLLVKNKIAHALSELIRRKHLGDSFNMAVDLSEERVGTKGEDGRVRSKIIRRPVSLRLFGCMGMVRLPLAGYLWPDTSVFRKKAAAAENTLTIDAQPLIRALAMLEPLSTDVNRCVYCYPEQGKLILERRAAPSRALNYGIGASLTLPAEYSGKLSRLAFPLRQLTAIIKGFAGAESITWRMVSAEGVCQISADNDPREIILMPMKIVDDYEYTVGEGA